MVKKPQLHVYPDTTALVEGLALWLDEVTHENIKDHGMASWAVSGGSTPIPLYQLFAERPRSIPWGSVRLYLVDERDVYPTDPQSNYGMLQESFLDHLNPPPARTYRWETVGNPREALARYRQALGELPQKNGFPVLDIALAGMGGDGHTASVFPGSPQFDSNDWVSYGPGPHANRFTLTLPLLANAGAVAFLVSGTDKAPRVKECIEATSVDLPAARLSRDAADVHWFLDQEAARDL